MTVSPSASVAVGVAVIVWLVVGLDGEMATLATTGAELATVTADEVNWRH